ncbi:hypothetical protein [uncultured Aeromicrobium sp.]|uniref:hypothetical protein n=1 Tax=uncultured Aeromicrobium sp. TaxID=337820 RepID=UPI0025DA319F|nr:hypothetical protein [uncultured Aeromicrobium sp.]
MSDPTPTFPGPAPLAGALVLDTTRALVGEHTAMMLGDLDARAIGVEGDEEAAEPR